MTERARTLAWGSFAVSVALSLATAVFIALAWRIPLLPTEFGFKGYTILFSLVVGGVGAVLASRVSSNPIGWIFCGLGILAGIIGLGEEYARWALFEKVGHVPLGLYGAWIQEWTWMPLIVGLGVVAWIFPDGSFLSRRWKVAMVVMTALIVVPMALNAAQPRLSVFAGFPNPLGLRATWIRSAATASIGLILPVTVGGAAAATVRFRRGHGDERQQIKWLLLSVSLLGVLLAYYGVLASIGASTNTGFALWASYAVVAAFLGVPVSVALGVLKYRLYDLDVVINKTVVYGGLAVFITAIYVAIVAGVGAIVGGGGSPGVSAAAAAIVALAFQPLRRRAQHLANRLVYGKRSTPYEVLSGFSDRLAGSYSVDDVLPRMARVLGEAIGADRVIVWLSGATGFVPVAAWPSPVAREPASQVPDGGVEVRHQGEILGAISVQMPASEPLAGPSSKLLTDLASQAGLVLRNATLVADLRASRQRLVTAQDQERRRIERNIHDGAQQQLVALGVQLRLLEQQVERDPAAAKQTVARLQDEATLALEDLRDLARGIYPPLLADRGLEAALDAQARRSPVPVTVDADEVGRLPQQVESAVYFSVLEALQNVAKYAEASRASISLGRADGHLTFTVTDDGRGFDLSRTTYGTGLQGIADRMAVIGGTLEVRSSPGAGTTLAGRLPVDGSDR